MAGDPKYLPVNSPITRDGQMVSNPWALYFQFLLTQAAASGSGTVTHTAGALTINEVVLGNGTDDVKVLGSYGTSGHVLTSNGAGLAPTFQAVSGGTVTHTGALTANQLVLGNGTDDIKPLGSLGTTTTVYHGNAGGAGSFSAVSLTADVTGTLAVASGGTNITSYAQGDLLYASATTTLLKLAKDTNATRYLSNTGTTNNPAWAQVDLTNGVSGDLPFSSLVQASGASKLVGRGSAAGAGDFQELTISTGLTLTGTVLTASGSGGTVTAVTHVVSCILGDGSSVVATGAASIVRIPYTGTITEAALYASDAGATAGAITVTLYKDNATNPPTTAVVNTGAGGTKPFLSATNNYLDTTLAHWTTSVVAGDFLKVVADATPTTVLQVTLALTIVGST